MFFCQACGGVLATSAQVAGVRAREPPLDAVFVAQACKLVSSECGFLVTKKDPRRSEITKPPIQELVLDDIKGLGLQPCDELVASTFVDQQHEGLIP